MLLGAIFFAATSTLWDTSQQSGVSTITLIFCASIAAFLGTILIDLMLYLFTDQNKFIFFDIWKKKRKKLYVKYTIFFIMVFI